MSFEDIPEQIRKNISFKKQESRVEKLISSVAGTACISILCLVSLNLTMSLEKIMYIQMEKIEQIRGKLE